MTAFYNDQLSEDLRHDCEFAEQIIKFIKSLDLNQDKTLQINETPNQQSFQKMNYDFPTQENTNVEIEATNTIKKLNSGFEKSDTGGSDVYVENETVNIQISAIEPRPDSGFGSGSSSALVNGPKIFKIVKHVCRKKKEGIFFAVEYEDISRPVNSAPFWRKYESIKDEPALKEYLQRCKPRVIQAMAKRHVEILFQSKI